MTLCGLHIIRTEQFVHLSPYHYFKISSSMGSLLRDICQIMSYDSLATSRGFQMLICLTTVVFLRPLTIDGYILLIIWSAVLPQHLSHMHAQVSTWISLCVSPIHLLVLVLRMSDRMCHLIVVLVVQLTQTHLLRQSRIRVQ